MFIIIDKVGPTRLQKMKESSPLPLPPENPYCYCTSSITNDIEFFICNPISFYLQFKCGQVIMNQRRVLNLETILKFIVLN